MRYKILIFPMQMHLVSQSDDAQRLKLITFVVFLFRAIDYCKSARSGKMDQDVVGVCKRGRRFFKRGAEVGCWKANRYYPIGTKDPMLTESYNDPMSRSGGIPSSVSDSYPE